MFDKIYIIKYSKIWFGRSERDKNKQYFGL